MYWYFSFWNKQDALIEEISNSEIVVIRSGTTLTENVLQHAKALKIIARCGVGVDNIDMSYTKENNIKVTNSPAANLLSVVEFNCRFNYFFSKKDCFVRSTCEKF